MSAFRKPSVTYTVARIHVRGKQLIDQETLMRMLDAPDDATVLRMLRERGYGASLQSDDYEEMIDNELAEVCRFLRKNTPNAYAIDSFLLKYDCHNLKAILKSQLLEKDYHSLLSQCGTVSIGKTIEAFENKKFLAFSKHLADTTEALIKKIETGIEVLPQQIEAELDDACFLDMADYAKKSKEQLVINAIESMADFQNIISLFRVQKAKQGEASLNLALVSGGSIEKKKYIESYSLQPDAISKHLGFGKYNPYAQEGIEDYMHHQSLVTLERKKDDYVTDLFKKEKHQYFTLAPILGYFIAKEREGQAIKLMMVAKINQVPRDLITERLRELYA